MNEPIDPTLPTSGLVPSALDLLDSHLFRSVPELPPLGRQIFTNRDLFFDQIGTVGFDMDYTIAPYKKIPMETLAHQLTVQKLINNLNYPKAIEDKPYNPTFVIRGLMVDKKLGNIFKIDRFYRVGRCYHGSKRLSKEEIRAIYRKERITIHPSRYTMVDTLFALPEMSLYADLVDYFDSQKALGHDVVSYEKLFWDIRNSIDEAHRDESLKSIILKSPETYIEDDPALALTLHKLRSSGKRLFLLTNSEWNYTNGAMRYLLEGKLPQYPSWRHYFDVIITSAQKPAWFTEQRPFAAFNIGDHDELIVDQKPIERFLRNKVYVGGNLKDFERLSMIRGNPMGEKVLYVGDHIYGDILKTKKTALWRTAFVSSELEHEIQVAEQFKEEFQELTRLDELRQSIDQKLLYNQAIARSLSVLLDKPEDLSERDTKQIKNHLKLLEDERENVKLQLKQLSKQSNQFDNVISNAVNPYWGLVFKENHENTLFATQAVNYACIYTSRVSNLSYYSPFHYFKAPRSLVPHEYLFK